jgi:hypothetical protein
VSRDYTITVVAFCGNTITEATFILRVMNPCIEPAGALIIPEWCPKNESTFWSAELPEWM